MCLLCYMKRKLHMSKNLAWDKMCIPSNFQHWNGKKVIVWSFFASEKHQWEYVFQKWECCDKKVSASCLNTLIINKLTYLNFQSMAVIYKLCDYHSAMTLALKLKSLSCSKSEWGLKWSCCEVIVLVPFLQLIFLSLHIFWEVGRVGRRMETHV